METMDDFKDELEASFRQIREGDIITGTVIAVSEEEITLDLKYYAQGIIKVEDFSNDPDFAVLEQIHAGDEIEATVVKTDDGQGNILLSRKEANDVLAWEKLQQMMEDGTVVKVRIKESESVHLFLHPSLHLIMWKTRRAGSEKRWRQKSSPLIRKKKNWYCPQNRWQKRQQSRNVTTRFP